MFKIKTFENINMGDT